MQNFTEINTILDSVTNFSETTKYFLYFFSGKRMENSNLTIIRISCKISEKDNLILFFFSLQIVIVFFFFPNSALNFLYAQTKLYIYGHINEF